MKKNQMGEFARFIEEKGLKSTTQRDEIVNVFFTLKDHVSIEELHHKVQKKNPKIGYTTVYRTLKLLTESGLAHERQFGDGQARYEPVTTEEHHDHLICLRCGTILEFENKKIEKLQEDVAKQHGFEVKNHKLELYGYCKKCRK
ncbi:MAG: transcriptional repressor [Deltaproteobacteria bacterium]|nr:transcriptional repressor [Deltaproteobacteria bacterium]